MAQEIITALWCDPHLRENNERVPGKTRSNGVLIMEICEDHAHTISLDAFDSLLEKYGRKQESPRHVSKGPASASKKKSGSTLTEEEIATRICRFGCANAKGKPFASPRGVLMHLTRTHAEEMETLAKMRRGEG